MAAGWVGEGGPFPGGGVHKVTAAEFNELRRPYYVDGSALDVVSTAAAASIFSLAIPGGTIGANGKLSLRLVGDYLNNDGAGRTLTLSVAFGGTQYYGDVSASLTNNATRRIWKLDLDISNANSLTAQFMYGEMLMGPIGATVGLGDLASVTPVVFAPIGAYPQKDTASAQDLSLSIQHSASSANLSFRRFYAQLVAFPADV